MKKVGRRGFMGLIGLGAVSGPLAARQAAQAEIAKLTTLAGPSVMPMASGQGIGTGGPPVDESQQYIKMSNYLKVFGRLPEHIEYNVRERSKSVYHLDSDIAALRSFSLAAKIAWQRERNYEKEVERYRRMGWYEMAQNSFHKLAGFRWSW